MAENCHNTPGLPSQMKRRALLKFFPAVAVLPAVAMVPALAIASNDTPIMTLYRQWAPLYERINSFDGDDATDEMFNDLSDIENAIFAVEPQTSADALAKLVVYSHGYVGDLHVGELLGGFLAEARILIGGVA